MRTAHRELRIRGRGAACAGVLALACLGTACEEMITKQVYRQYSHDVGDLSSAVRIEVMYESHDIPQSGTSESRPVATITDRRRVAALAAFVGDREGWNAIISASPAQRTLAFYDDKRLLGEIGVFFQGITHDIHLRQLTAAEYAELIDLLGVPWPSFPRPQREAPPP